MCSKTILRNAIYIWNQQNKHAPTQKYHISYLDSFALKFTNTLCNTGTSSLMSVYAPYYQLATSVLVHGTIHFQQCFSEIACYTLINLNDCILKKYIWNTYK